jgi:lipoprotein-anchoring transpeptidase ErfK/SrfK
MQDAGRKIEVSVAEQRLRVVDELGREVASWPVSTSRFGTGCEEGSHKTPTGKFRVAERHGDGAPERTIFRSRRPEGVWDPSEPVEGDLVLTRILWLEGAEEANANTKQRYIYIHGTNQEDRIGEPASIGCVRMRNADVIALYELAPEGTEVEIVV